MGQAGASITCGNAIDTNTTPNNPHDESDEIQGCTDFWYAGLGGRDRMGCIQRSDDMDDWNRKGQARSRHSSGVNVCFADGSVHNIRTDITQLVWYYMLSRDDGIPYSYH